MLEEWRGGRTSWEGWSESTEGARAEFAKLVNTDPGRVAIGATVSGLVGLVAASLPAGSRVVIPEIEFTSTLFPFLVQPGLEVSTVPPARLAEAIDEHTDAVAFSAVQMSTGEVADLDAILAAAEAHDVLTVVDATQAAGWLPLEADRFDFLVAAGYKWLISPRGTAWMTVAPERLDAIVPSQAGWYAGEDVYEAYIGPPLRLAHDARRLDTSPAWFSWVGALPALELLNAVGRRGDPRSTTSRWPTASGPGWGWSRRTPRSCRWSGRVGWSGCAPRACRRRSPEGGCASGSTSTTTRRTPTLRSASSQVVTSPKALAPRAPAKRPAPSGRVPGRRNPYPEP